MIEHQSAASRTPASLTPVSLTNDQRRRLRVLRSALRASEGAVVNDGPGLAGHHLASQLLARLGPPGVPDPGRPFADDADQAARMDALLRGMVEDQPGPWLMPRRRSMRWDHGRFQRIGTHGSPVLSLTTVARGDRTAIVTGGSDGRVLLWDLADGANAGDGEGQPRSAFRCTSTVRGMTAFASSASADTCLVATRLVAAADFAGQLHLLEWRPGADRTGRG